MSSKSILIILSYTVSNLAELEFFKLLSSWTCPMWIVTPVC